MYAGVTGFAIALPLIVVSLIAAGRRPELLLPGLPPLLFMLGLAPQSVTPAVVLYAVYAIYAGLGTLLAHWPLTWHWLRRLWPALACLAAVIAVNAIVAQQNGVSLAGWSRGFVPFAFLLVILPASVGMSANRQLPKLLIIGGIAATGLYALGGGVEFVSHGLWAHPNSYVYIDGSPIPATAAAAEAMGRDLTYAWVRLVSVYRMASDPLLGLGAVFGLLVFMHARSKAIRAAAFTLALAAAILIVTTYTRSLWVALAISLAAVFVTGFFSRHRRSALVGAVCFALLVAGFAYASGILSAQFNRSKETIAYITTGLGVGSLSAFLTDITTSPFQDETASNGQPAAAGDAPRPQDDTGAETESQSASPAETGAEVAKRPNRSSGDPNTGTSTDPGAGDTAAPPSYDERKKADQKSDYARGDVERSVNARAAEYAAAWKVFTDAPILGRGLGYKPEIVWRGSPTTVHHMHNVITYTIARGGLIFAVLYAGVLLGPVVLAFWLPRYEYRIAIWTAALFLIPYAMFFAVFRLLSFNLLVGLAWAVVLAGLSAHRARTARNTQQPSGQVP